jgi:pyruvate,water dikinase
MILNAARHSEAGAHRQHHQALAEAGEAAGERLVAAARHGALGFLRAALVRRLVRVLRYTTPIREHPKYLLMRAFDLTKLIIIEGAAILKQHGCLQNVEDVWLLELGEVIEALEQPSQDLQPLIAQRKADLARFQGLRPPRVITSQGEIITATQTRDDMPEGALAGNPVSAGVVEGRARVILDPQAEILKPGEILVAPFTDPGWTPLFINAAALVMEVGGLMTHGSVVAREYGIPAVVGVIEATQRIKTGQRLRVHGDAGYVEILPDIDSA